MVDVAGKILNVKAKTSRRSGADYQSVTMKRADGKKFWFANYSSEEFVYGDHIRVVAESTADGNNVTFLNKVQKVERLTQAAPPPGRRPPAAAAPSPAPAPSAAVPTGAEPSATTGWEDEDDPVVVDKTAPEEMADHSVTENAAPLGTLDDLADGVDPSRYGGVVIFRKGTTKAEVEFLLRAMAGVLDVSDVREYDEKVGFPVFYIP